MKPTKKQLHIVAEPTYSQRKRKGLCVVAFCCNKAGNKGKFRFCYKHHREHQKYNNPLRYWFDVLRQNAKRRNKEFSLNIDEFRDFCERTKYLENKGRSPSSYSIDRINNELGYSKDNIQVCSFGGNSRKYWIDLKIQFGYYPTDDELKEWADSAKTENSEPPRVIDNPFDTKDLSINFNEDSIEDLPF